MTLTQRRNFFSRATGGRRVAPRSLRELGAILCLWFWSAWPFIEPGSHVYGFDTLAYTGPNLSATFRAWRGFEIPLWESGMFGGVPFLGRLGSQGLYLLNAPFLIFEINEALDLLAAFHLLIFAVGMWVLARKGLRLGTAAGFIASVAVLGAGYTAVKMLSFDQLVALAWAPWVLFSIHIALQNSRRLASAGPLALCGSFLILGGHPQYIYMTAILATFFLIFRFIDNRSIAGIRNVLLAGLLSLMTTSLQMTSAYFLGTSSAVPTKRSLGALSAPNYVLHPTRTAVAILGNPFSPTPTSVSGSGEALLAVGSVVVVLALFGLLFGNSDHRAFRLGAALVSVLCTVLAVGSRWFPFRILYHLIPGFGAARVPGRWLFVPLMFLPLLAGLGIETIRRTDRRSVASVVCVTAIGLLGWMGSTIWPLRAPSAGVAAWWLAVLVAVICAFQFNQTLSLRRIGLIAVVLSLLLETYLPSRHSPASLQRWPESFASSVASDAETQGSIDGLYFAQTFDRYDDFSYLVENLRPNTQLLSNIRSIDGYDGGQWIQKRWVTTAEALTTRSFALDLTIRSQTRFPIDAKLMRKFGVRYVLVETSVLPANQQLAGWRGPLSRRGTIELWENPFWLGSGTAYLKSELPQGSIKNSLRKQNKDVALVESPKHVIDCDGECAAQGVSRLSTGQSSGSFIFNIASDGILAIDQSWSPDWKVYVDGIRSPSFPVNGNQLGVYFEAGFHKIEYQFDPMWFDPLFALSLFGLSLATVLTLGFIVGIFREKRQSR
jgi:hypothetical protein